MPIVFACIMPNGASGRTRPALAEVAEELSGASADVAIVIAAARRPAQAIGISSSEDGADIADLILRAADAEAIPVATQRGDVAVPDAIAGSLSDMARAGIATSRLQPRFHFEFGRIAGRVLAEREERAAVICETGLAADRAGRAFGDRYRRAIESWDVKWLAGLDPETRRLTGEACVAQTAVLMGALSWCRIQPRVRHYDENAGAIVVTIDVLGPRGKAGARSV